MNIASISSMIENGKRVSVAVVAFLVVVLNAIGYQAGPELQEGIVGMINQSLDLLNTGALTYAGVLALWSKIKASKKNV